MSEGKLDECRNFVNKLWNAARFVRVQLGSGARPPANLEPISLADRWIRSRSQATVAEVDSLLADFQLGEAARVIKDFIWSEYCDWYLEIAKVQLREASPEAHQSTLASLVDVLDTVLRLLHPFAPFVTEEIWQGIRRPDDVESIMLAAWPDTSGRDPAAEADFAAVSELVTAVRRLRSDYRVEWSRRIEAIVEAGRRVQLLQGQSAWVGSLGRLEPLAIVGATSPPPRRALSVVAGGVRAYLPVAGLFDLEQELARLGKERDQVATQADRSEQLLGRPGFVEKARPEVVEAEREKLTALRQRLMLLDERIATLSGMMAEQDNHAE
jgi:valyl-tRNA synthetase